MNPLDNITEEQLLEVTKKANEDQRRTVSISEAVRALTAANPLTKSEARRILEMLLEKLNV